MNTDILMRHSNSHPQRMPWDSSNTVSAFTISEALGVVPFKDGKLTVSNVTRFVVLCMSITALATYTVTSGNIAFAGPESQAPVVRITIGLLQFLLSPTVGLISSILITLERRSLRRAFHILLSLEPNRNHDWHLYLSISIFTVATVFDFFVYRCYVSVTRLMTSIAYYLPIFVIILIESQFTCAVELVKDRYSAAVNLLQFASSHHQIRTLLVKMRDIDNAASLINKAYSMPLLLIFFTVFCLITSQAYYVVSIILVVSNDDGPQKENWYNMLVFSNVILLLTFEIWKITWACSTTKNKGTTFNKKLYGMCLNGKYKEFCRNIWIKFHLLNKHNPSFTAYRFFNIDMAVLQSMLGASATYIVIMVQFQSSQF